MSGEAITATIKGRSFKLSAPEQEQKALSEAIALVESKCARILQKAPSIEIERVLLLVALELAASGKPNAILAGVATLPESTWETALTRLQSKLDLALSNTAGKA